MMTKLTCSVCGMPCDKDVVSNCPECAAILCEECSEIYGGYCEKCQDIFSQQYDD
ncbi:hypothetical protein [Xylanivirga thermophila]|uniref:hypothetical protein n=1 Tax=Xylanivirga thermophila TaxID=2496273 RepID=UPI0013EDD32B|nr:hypothetical protein [Xylanivirga thermophila]